MKDLITTIGAIYILMIFVLQFSANQVLAGRIFVSDRIVEEYAAEAAAGNLQREDELDELAQRLSESLKCDKTDVRISEEEKSYSIEAPVENIIACAPMLGISDEKNKIRYVRKVGKGVSEMEG